MSDTSLMQRRNPKAQPGKLTHCHDLIAEPLINRAPVLGKPQCKRRSMTPAAINTRECRAAVKAKGKLYGARLTPKLAEKVTTRILRKHPKLIEAEITDAKWADLFEVELTAIVATVVKSWL